MASYFGAIGFALTASDKDFHPAIRRTIKSSDAMERSMAKTQLTVRKLRGGIFSLGGALAIGGLHRLAGGIKSVTDEASKLVETSRRLDITTERLQLLGRVSAGEGGSLNEITKGLERFQRAISEAAEGVAEYSESFEALGVETADILGNARSTEAVFDDVVAALGRVRNEADRTRFAYDVFGRSSRSLVNVAMIGNLRAQEDAFRQFGVTTQEQDERLKALGQRFTNLGDTVGTASKRMVVALEPVITRLVQLAQAFGNVGNFIAGGFIDQQRPLVVNAAQQALDTTEKVRELVNLRVGTGTIPVPTDQQLRQQLGQRATPVETPEDRQRFADALARGYEAALRAIQAEHRRFEVELAKTGQEMLLGREGRQLETVRGELELERQLAGLITTQERDRAKVMAILETTAEIERKQLLLQKALTDETRKRLETEIKLLEARRLGQAQAFVPGGVTGQIGLIRADIAEELPETARRYEEITARIASKMEVLGEAGRRVFDGIGKSIENAILQTDSWGDALSRIGRLLAFRALETFLGSETFGGLFGGARNRLRPTGRAYGGPVAAGTLYEVNERGKEYFRPNMSGTVIPLGASDGGGTVVFNNTYNIEGAQDPELIVNAIAEYDRRQRSRDLRSKARMRGG